MNKKHFKRWFTGLAALPLLIPILVLGGSLFYGFVALIALITLWEYFFIVFKDSDHHPFGIFSCTGYLAALGIVMGAAYGSASGILVGLSLNFILVALMSIFRFQSHDDITATVATQVLGVLYIPTMLGLLVILRNQPDGVFWIFFILIIVFIGDTSAYHVGSRFGRHKLYPAVSPGKTWEGAFGGLAANLLAGSLYKAIFLPELPWGACLLFILSAGIIGQVGDLFESQFKRLKNVKDSGVMLPGHGGFLDRIDALLFAAPVAFLFHRLMG